MASKTTKHSENIELKLNAARIGFVSLGCPKNLVDSERILTQLRIEGYEVVSSYDDAELVIVNTCGFIDIAVQESLDTIDEALAENGKVIVTGCLGAKENEIRKLHPNVLAITGPNSYESVVELVHQHLPKPTHNPFEGLVPDCGVKLTPKHYAYLKIAEGCNHSCTFCVIPSLRGALVSKPVGDVINEAQRLVNAGVEELLVIAQDTAAYGSDVSFKTDFADGMPVKTNMLSLCEQLANLGVWVRLQYVYPTPEVDAAVTMMAEGKILPYLDMPLQHVSSRILELMQRPNHSENMLARIEKWREACPELVLRATFIVGFPGETEAEFEALLTFLKTVQFDRISCFKYSAVDGAAANELPDAIDEDIKDARLARVMDVQKAISTERLKTKIGLEYQVIIDSVDEEGAIGRTYADAPEIDGVVFINGEFNLTQGERVWVQVIHADEHDLWGALVDEELDDESDEELNGDYDDSEAAYDSM